MEQEKQSNFEVPDTWNSMSDDEKDQWISDVLMALLEDSE